MSRGMARWWAYLSVVLYATCNDWVDGEFSLFVQCRCRHGVCGIALSDWNVKFHLMLRGCVFGQETGDRFGRRVVASSGAAQCVFVYDVEDMRCDGFTGSLCEISREACRRAMTLCWLLGEVAVLDGPSDASGAGWRVAVRARLPTSMDVPANTKTPYMEKTGHHRVYITTKFLVCLVSSSCILQTCLVFFLHEVRTTLELLSSHSSICLMAHRKIIHFCLHL
jgi:hypothetical protein